VTHRPRHRGSSKYVAERRSSAARVLTAAVGLVERRTISRPSPVGCVWTVCASWTERLPPGPARHARAPAAVVVRTMTCWYREYTEFAPTTMNVLHSLQAPALSASTSALWAFCSARTAQDPQPRPDAARVLGRRVHRFISVKRCGRCGQVASQGRHAGRNGAAHGVISRARGLRTPCTTSVSAGSRSDLCAKQSSRPRALGTACAESRSVVHHPLLSAAEGASLLARTTAQSGLITALVSGVLQPGAAPPTCAPRRPTGVTLPLGAAPRAAQRQRGPAATLASRSNASNAAPQ
jgi:hypothetical protein